MDVMMKRCTTEDIDVLREFAESLYYDTFKGMCSDEDLQAYLEEAFDEKRITDEMNNPYSEFYFLYSGDELAGYLKLNEAPAQGDINDEKSLELERIYVSNKFQGAGYGAYLMNQAISIAGGRGKEYIWLGVWERNVKAIKFYEKYDFYKIAMHDFIVGEDVQHDYVMKKDL